MAAPPSTGSASGRSQDSRRGRFARNQARTAESSSARSLAHGTASGSASSPRTSAPSVETDRRSRAVEDRERAGAHEPRVGPAAGQRIGQCAQPVPHEPRLLVAFLLGEVGHASFERSEEPARGGQGGDEPPDELSVALGIDAAVARGDAPAHVGQGARRESRPRAHRRRAPADRQDLFDGFLRELRRGRRSERPEIGAAVVRRGRAHDLQPGERLGGIDLEVRVLAATSCHAGCTSARARGSAVPRRPGPPSPRRTCRRRSTWSARAGRRSSCARRRRSTT